MGMARACASLKAKDLKCFDAFSFPFTMNLSAIKTFQVFCFQTSTCPSHSHLLTSCLHQLTSLGLPHPYFPSLSPLASPADTLVSLLLQLKKATMLGESSFIFSPGSLCYSNVYRHESGRYCTLPFFITFFIISSLQVFLLYYT